MCKNIPGLPTLLGILYYQLNFADTSKLLFLGEDVFFCSIPMIFLRIIVLYIFRLYNHIKSDIIYRFIYIFLSCSMRKTWGRHYPPRYPFNRVIRPTGGVWIIMPLIQPRMRTTSKKEGKIWPIQNAPVWSLWVPKKRKLS